MPAFRMLAKISGTRDGADWPAAGETVNLPETEGVAMVASGLATVEAADAPLVETATMKTSPKRKA